jgi:hypothetical protein
MYRIPSALAVTLDFVGTPVEPVRKGNPATQRMPPGAHLPSGLEKYRYLDIERRRAQIRARHALGVVTQSS